MICDRCDRPMTPAETETRDMPGASSLLPLVEVPVHVVLPRFPGHAASEAMPVASAGIPGIMRGSSFE